jgi:hypothetical protein
VKTNVWILHDNLDWSDTIADVPCYLNPMGQVTLTPIDGRFCGTLVRVEGDRALVRAELVNPGPGYLFRTTV